MEIALYLIVPTLILAGIIFFIFFWSIDSNQYDDLDGAPNRFLHINERKTPKDKK